MILRTLILYIFFLSGFLTIGQNVDSLQLKLKNTARASEERVNLLNEIGYALWIQNPKESVSKGKKAYNLAQELKYEFGMASAKRIQGVGHWALGEPKQALECLTEAKNLFSSLQDDQGVANCMLNIGMVYADIGELDRAQQLYESAIIKFETLSLQGRVATTFTKLGMIYMERGMLPDALNYFTNALRIHSENNFLYGVSEAHNRLGQLYLLQNNLEQADYHIRQSLIDGRKVNDEDGMVNNLILLGRLQQEQGDIELAEMHVNLALRRARDKRLNNYRLQAINELKKIKRRQGQLDSALYYSDAYISLKDSIYPIQKAKEIAAIEFNNQLEAKNQELDFLEEKNRNATRTQWILFVGIWVIGLLSIFLVKSLRSRNKNQKQLLATQQEISRATIENQQLRQHELKKELDFKNKELTSYALNFVQKNKLLESLQAKIAEIKTSKGQEDYKKQLNQLAKIIRRHTNTEKDWEDFRFHFDKVHTNFFKKLKEKYPSLSPNDFKVAALTQLNLSIKETAGILGISPESTKTARYRLRKKLDLNPEEDLFEFLFSLNSERT